MFFIDIIIYQERPIKFLFINMDLNINIYYSELFGEFLNKIID